MRRTHMLFLSLLLAACSSSDGSKSNDDPSNNQPADMGSNNTSDDTGTSTDSGGDQPDEGADPADMVGDDAAMPDMSADIGDEPDMMMPDMSNPGMLYASSGDPYAAGPLTVTQVDVAAGGTLPVDITIHAPQDPGEYAVIVFHHGFNLLATYYSTILDHVASHGFIVVAPQMYTPGFIGAPTAAEEAVDAMALYAWVATSLDAEVAVDARTDLLGLVGHSRGAKVLWLALEAGFAGATAAVGLDPVDGMGGPFGGEARVLAGGLSANLPSLTIGAELSAQTVFGMACAPTGDDHAAFYAGAPSPAYWAYAEGYGHLDMLDAQTPGCGLTCTACVDGPTDGNFRLFSAGQIVGFFRWQLQGDATAETYATAANGAPVTTQFMNK